MLLLIDNYDSFTYNLYQYFVELGQSVIVYRNNQITLEEIERLHPTAIIISPGPGGPLDAGISVSVIQYFKGRLPILGVCLGHQSIAYALGGEIIRAKQVMHGKTSLIHHQEKGVFKNLPNPFKATRYHSLVVRASSLPEELEVTAWTLQSSGEPEEIMGIRHKTWLLEGVQFHPEAILTEHGHALLNNFLVNCSNAGVVQW